MDELRNLSISLNKILLNESLCEITIGEVTDFHATWNYNSYFLVGVSIATGLDLKLWHCFICLSSSTLRKVLAEEIYIHLPLKSKNSELPFLAMMKWQRQKLPSYLKYL